MKLVFVFIAILNFSAFAQTNNKDTFVDIDKTVSLIKNHKTDFALCFAKVFKKDLGTGVVHLCKANGNRCPSYSDCVNPKKNMDVRLVFNSGCAQIEKGCKGGSPEKSGNSCVFKNATCEIGTFLNQRDGYSEFVEVTKDVSCKLPKSGDCGTANSCSRSL